MVELFESFNFQKEIEEFIIEFQIVIVCRKQIKKCFVSTDYTRIFG